MCRHVERCLRVLLALQNDVKLVRGAAQPLILANFYLHIFEKLRTILRNPDVEKAFDELIVTLRAFCERMRSSAHKPPPYQASLPMKGFGN